MMVSWPAVSFPQTNANQSGRQFRSKSFENRGPRRGQSVDGQKPLEFLLRCDPTILDGSFANNGWLQELPKPLTKITWDNAVLMSPATAKKFGVSYQIGQPAANMEPFTPMLSSSSMRDEAARSGLDSAGPCRRLCNAASRLWQDSRRKSGHQYRLQCQRAIDIVRGFTRCRAPDSVQTGERYPLACTQFHHLMEGRHLLRSATLPEYRKNPNVVHEMAGKRTTSRASTPASNTTAMPGACPSISTPASAATPAWLPVKPKTTGRWSARRK